MPFDRLTPVKWGVLYSCVRKTAEGYQVVAVPPSLILDNTDAKFYRRSVGWGEALCSCLDMPVSRRDYLNKEMRNLIANPKAYWQLGGLA